MASFTVQSEPVSFKGHLYAPGEVLDATEQEAAGWLQAGYVKKAPAKKPVKAKAKK